MIYNESMRDLSYPASLFLWPLASGWGMLFFAIYAFMVLAAVFILPFGAVMLSLKLLSPIVLYIPAMLRVRAYGKRAEAYMEQFVGARPSAAPVAATAS